MTNRSRASIVFVQGWRLSIAHTVFEALRQSSRPLRAQPRFTAAVVLVLGLGIGANCTLFTVIDNLVIRPLPYNNPADLVEISLPPKRPPLVDLRRAQAFSGIAVFLPWGFDVAEPTGVSNVFGFRVSANIFTVLGVPAAMGRVFSATDDRRTVMLAHHYWRRISNDPQLVGRTLTIGGEPYTVIGVLPADFVLWFRDATIFVPDTPPQGRVLGRLKEGVRSQQALAEVQGMVKPFEPGGTAIPGATQITVLSRAFVGTNDVETLLMLQAAVGMVLLITCANVGNLLLVRAASRRKEFAIRRAIGAGRMRLFSQLMAESLLVGGMGGALGLLATVWGRDVVRSQLPASISRTLRGADGLSIDLTVVAFTIAISLLTVLVVGLAPATVALRNDLASTLRDVSGGASPGRQRLGRLLVIGEIALALMLLIGSGLTLKSLIGLQNAYLGFNAERVLRAGINLQQYNWSSAQRIAAVSDIVNRCKGLPGVESVGLLAPSVFPFGGPRVRGAAFVIQGRSEAAPRAEVYTVGGDYFRALQIPLLRGRLFSDADTSAATPVAIISEVVATRHWGATDPMGSLIRLQSDDPASAWVTVVGVVGDVRNPVAADVQPIAYRPYAQHTTNTLLLMIRAAIEPDRLAEPIRRELEASLPKASSVRVANLQRAVRNYVSPQRFTTSTLGGFAGLALLLASVGVYGVMRQWVSARFFEIGVRVALGAQRRDIVRLVIGGAATTALVGVGAGIAGALALRRVIESQLHGVSSTDLTVFAGVSVAMAAAAIAAAVLPARWAMQVDPIVTLRQN